MTAPTDPSCRVDGARHLSESAADAEICDRFQQRFFSGVAETNQDGRMSFAITIEKSGTIDAVVTKLSDSVQTVYPSVSVDVMDRGLNMSDIERLAGAAAQMVTNEEADHSAASS